MPLSRASLEARARGSDWLCQRVVLARLAVLVRLTDLARLADLARLRGLTACGPIAGETPPVCAWSAGRTRVEPLSCGVGRASPLGLAPSQKFNSADFTWLLAEK